MTKIIPLTPEQKRTFEVLRLRSNVASVLVLGEALRSQSDCIRMGALETLASRGGEQDMAAILDGIDHCTERALPLLLSQVPMLLGPIESGLASSNLARREKSLRAIAKLRISSQFHHLVRVAQTSEDPLQLVASELLLEVTHEYGMQAKKKKSKASETIRESLLNDLMRSMELFHEHRVIQIFDAWLGACHWDDVAFQNMFSGSRRDNISKLTLQQLKRSRRSETLELTAGILWSDEPEPAALKVVAEQNERTFAIHLAELVNRYGITPTLNRNLKQCGSIIALNDFCMKSDEHSIEQRCGILKLIMAMEITPDRALANLLDLLESGDPQAEATCILAMRNFKIKPEIALLVLNDGFESPDLDAYVPPPWKGALRTQLDRLIELYPNQSLGMRASIEFAFSDFRCEELLNHFDDWAESHLFAYGKMVRIADRGYVEFIDREFKSQSSVKRARSIKAIRFLGMHGRLEEIATEALTDRTEIVRIEAIYTLAPGLQRSNAIEMLRPLCEDAEVNVRVAANFAMSQLGGAF